MDSDKEYPVFRQLTEDNLEALRRGLEGQMSWMRQSCRAPKALGSTVHTGVFMVRGNESENPQKAQAHG